jgi:hypothetical protein
MSETDIGEAVLSSGFADEAVKEEANEEID